MDKIRNNIVLSRKAVLMDQNSSPEEVAEKILGHSASLGGISRLTFQLDNANLTHEQLKNTMRLIAEKVMPIINQE